MFVKHQAWLSSCPDDTTKTKDKRNRFTRYSTKNPDSTELSLPDVEGAEYLINLLHEAGPVGSNGYGVEGLKWSEIHSYTTLTGLFLCPWEVMLIKELSDVFASAYNEYNGKDCPPPYFATPKELPSKEDLNTKFEKIFGGMQVVDTRKNR